ncbi:hypothetical protein [Chitinophaga vietnamensis]|nr:hypothetical protein [Chitinophaga vietnamensis]
MKKQPTKKLTLGSLKVARLSQQMPQVVAATVYTFVCTHGAPGCLTPRC